MKTNLKRILAIVMSIAMLITLAACGSTSEPAAPAATSTEPASTATAETPAAEANTGIVLSADWPLYMDPGVGSKATDVTSFLNMYDTLIFPNDDATMSPLVAKSWEANADSTEFTFHLNEDVYFHSGNQLTASDVKFSMDRMLTLGEGYAYLFADIIKSCEVVDDFTIKFALNSPSGIFPSYLIRLYILDEDLVMANKKDGNYGEFGDYGKAFLQVNDAGSGPYKVKEMRTEEYLVMERYDDYWLGWDGFENAPETVKMVGGIDSTSMKTLIARGELDFSDDAQTPEAYQAMAEIDGVELQQTMLGNNFNIMLNTKLAPTDDIHFRKAMAYAFDYTTAAENIYLGSAPCTGPIPTGMAGGLTKEEFPYSFNLDKAMEELQQSPYYADLTSGAMKVSFTYCAEGGAQQEKFALLMKAGMAQLGVDIEITAKPFANMMSDAATIETTPNASTVVFAPSILDASGYLSSRYHSNSCGTWEQMEWLQDDEIDAMIEKSLTIADEAERVAMYKVIVEKLVDLCPTVWALDLATTTAVRTCHVINSPTMENTRNGVVGVYAMGYSSYFRQYEVQ